MATSVAIRNGLAGVLAGRKAYTAPESLYFGLSLNTIASDGTGIVEPAASTGYARVHIVNSNASFDDPVDGYVTNKVAFAFNEITEFGGTATDWFLATTPTGSNAIIWDKFGVGEQKVLQAGLTIRINVGNLKFNIFDA